MSESYTPREIIENINSNNPNGAKIDLYGSSKLEKSLQDQEIANGDIIASAQQEIKAEREEIIAETQEIKAERSFKRLAQKLAQGLAPAEIRAILIELQEARVDKAKDINQLFYEQWIGKNLAIREISDLEVYFDEDSGSAYIAHADHQPFVLKMDERAEGRFWLPPQLLVSKFDCSFTGITEITILPDSLTELDCSYSAIVYLPELPDSLTKLDCTGTKLPPHIIKKIEEQRKIIGFDFIM